MRTAITILLIAFGLVPLFGEEQPAWATLPSWAQQPPVSDEPESAVAPQEAQQPDQTVESTSAGQPQQTLQTGGTGEPGQTIPANGTIQSYSSHNPIHWQAPFVLADILRTAGVDSMTADVNPWAPLGIEYRQITKPGFEYVTNPEYREDLTDLLIRIRIARERSARFGR